MKEKIVITVGAGFIGFNLGYLLHSKGYDVLLLDDLSFGHLVNIGGFIILHDTTHPLYMEINEAIGEYFDDSWTKYSWFNNNGLQVMRRN